MKRSASRLRPAKRPPPRNNRRLALSLACIAALALVAARRHFAAPQHQPASSSYSYSSASLPVAPRSEYLRAIEPPRVAPERARNAHRTLFVLPGRENRCHYQYDYVCKFWFYLRCYVLAAFPRVRVLSLGAAAAAEFARDARPGDVALVVWRSKNHSAEPDLLTELLAWRDGGGGGDGDDDDKGRPRVRIGVLHIANEVAREHWPWYTLADFVVRNYWVADMPRHATYIPLGHQLPNNCEPWSTAGGPNATTTCSCGGLGYKRASRRKHVWHFGGSLRKRRAELLRRLRQSRALRDRGVVQVSRKFGGAGAFGSGGGDNPKTAYLAAMLESRFVFAPCGNAMETHRIYEALAVGAVPVVENCDPAVSAFLPLRRLLVDGGPAAMVARVQRLAADDDAVDALQADVARWWESYAEQVARDVARAVATHVPVALRTTVQGARTNISGDRAEILQAHDALGGQA